MLPPGTPIELSADQRPTRRLQRPARPHPASLRGGESGPPDRCAEIVHDLANAIAGVTSALAIATRRAGAPVPEASADVASALRSARAAAELAAAIVRELRDEGSREALSEIDLAGAIDEALAVVRAGAPEGAHLVSLAVEGPRVVARRRDLVRVLVNVLQNALEATDPERPNEIRVRTETREGSREIVVEDTGRGMDAQTLASVREGRAASRAQRRGIGLAITRRLVEAMGGRLGLDSVAGLGTRVRLSLPAPERAD